MMNYNTPDDDSSYKLMQFFQMYPHVWFNRLALFQISEYVNPAVTEITLNRLVNEGKVCSKIQNRVTLYTLFQQEQ